MTSDLAKASDLQVTVDESSQEMHVRLRGRLNLDSSPAFRDQLLAVVRRASTKAVAVDLTELSHIDASGIATLVEALRIARNRRNTLCLNGLQGRVLRLFELTGLLDLFETNSGRSAPIASKVP